MSRFLRPGFLMSVGGRLWVVDEFQPVAAVLDPVGGAVERLVSWPELPAPDTEASWRYFPRAGDSVGGVWAQPWPGGPVALLDTDGLVHASYVAGTRLCAVTEAGAWCAPQPRVQELTDTPDTPPRGTLHPDRLLLVRLDGTTRTVTVDRPVSEVRATEDGLCVRVDVEPWTRRHLGASTWELLYEQAWLHLPRDAAVPDVLTLSEHRGAEPSVPSLCSDGRQRGSPWHDPEEREEDGVEVPVAGGMRWEAGWDLRVGEQRHVIATGYDFVDESRRCRVELGAATVMALAGSQRWLWVALLRGGRVAPYVGGTVELVRVDTVDGGVDAVLPAESVEIGERCWPLPPKPVEADSYAEHQRRLFEGLETHWYPYGGGAPEPLAEGMRDCRADLVGDWPDTAVHISFAHTRFPGLRLVRVLPLFDELGRQQPPEYADVHLMEDIDTGDLPPPDEAVQGILYV